MFGRHLLRSFRTAWGGRHFGQRQGASHERTRQPEFLRRGVAAAALGGAAGAGQLVLNLARSPWGGRLAAGVASGSAATAAWHWRDDEEAVSFETQEIPWVQELAQQQGMREMLVPGQMLRKHPVGQLLTEDDHLVSWQSCKAAYSQLAAVSLPLEHCGAVESFGIALGATGKSSAGRPKTEESLQSVVAGLAFAPYAVVRSMAAV